MTTEKTEGFAFTEEEIKELDKARKMPITFDEDCPETTPERAIRFKRVNRSGGRCHDNATSQ